MLKFFVWRILSAMDIDGLVGKSIILLEILAVFSVMIAVVIKSISARKNAEGSSRMIIVNMILTLILAVLMLYFCNLHPEKLDMVLLKEEAKSVQWQRLG